MAEKIIEHSSKQMYIEDMVKYSIIVDRRRAFPEIKDGLKPVQRKVIFDMLELNILLSIIEYFVSRVLIAGKGSRTLHQSGI